MSYQSLSIVLNIILIMTGSSASYELIQKLPLGMGIADIESMAWDSTNNRWLTASWYSGAIYSFSYDTINNAVYDLNNETMYKIRNPYGAFPLQLNIWRNSNLGTAFSNDDLILNATTWRPAGMEIVDGILYVVDFDFGRVASWDLTTNILVNTTLITNTAGSPAKLDGLCHDPDNTEILYITDFGLTILPDSTWVKTGYEAIYRLNTNDWSWTRIYNTTTPININGASTVSSYTITANGCIVNGGKLYVVDYKLDDNAKKAWIIYDISTHEWMLDFEILPNGGDGLIYIPQIDTFYASDVVNGTLLKYTPSVDTKFEMVYSGMNSPADMDYNPQTRTIAIAEVYTGFVDFIQIDAALFTTTSYYTTTSSVNTDIDLDQANTVIVMLSVCLGFIMVLIA